MKTSAVASLGAILVLALFSTTTWADGAHYKVHITNLTRGQVFSPPLIVTHPKNLSLFALGKPASPELAALAQDGDNSKLKAALGSKRGVRLAEAGGPLLPGKSLTLRVPASGGHTVISVAGMLVTTNDAFFALNGGMLPRHKGHSVSSVVPAYDAGAEPNDERCAYIPGPPCGNPHAASGQSAEGYVHVHAGIHGIGDLKASERDWRNPVAKITVTRVSKH